MVLKYAKKNVKNVPSVTILTSPVLEFSALYLLSIMFTDCLHVHVQYTND